LDSAVISDETKMQEFLQLLENPALRPLKRQPNANSLQPAKLMPLEFTPVFMNLLRFSDHGSYRSKFTHKEIEKAIYE
jgi:hypothetical protein